MFTNNSLVIFHDEGNGYKRYDVERAFVNESESTAIVKSGNILKKGSYSLIPKEFFPKGLEIKKNTDLIVVGPCDLTIDNTNDKSISDSIKALKTSYTVYTVIGFTPKLYGSPHMHHYELTLEG